jgi:hypothetical protein
MENPNESIVHPVRIGRRMLPNRLVMAPMTRSRAAFDGPRSRRGRACSRRQSGFRRSAADAAMNEADHNTFFGGTARGYIDYPALSARTNTSS